MNLSQNSQPFYTIQSPRAIRKTIISIINPNNLGASGDIKGVISIMSSSYIKSFFDTIETLYFVSKCPDILQVILSRSHAQ